MGVRIVVASVVFRLTGNSGGGIGTGAVVAYELVKVLTGISIPRKEHASVPWSLITLLLSGALVSGTVATAASARWVGSVDLTRLRDP